MAEDIIFRTVIDDSQLDQALAKMETGITGVEEKIQELGEVASDSFSQAESAAGEMEATITTLGDATASAGTAAQKTGKQVKDAGVESKKFGDVAKQAASQVNVLGVNLGQVIEGLQNKQKALKGVISGMRGTVTVTKLLKAALISTGIGALVVILGSLVAWLTKTQEGLNFVRKASAAVGAAIAVITDRASDFFEVIKNVALFRFGKAAEAAKKATKDLGDEMAREIKLAQQLAQVLIDVEQAEANLQIRRAAANAKLKELNLTIEDTTKNTKERLAAAQQFADIEESLVTEEVANQEKRVAALLGFAEVTEEVRAKIQKIGQEGVSLDDLGLSKSTIQDAQEFAGEVQKLFDLQTRSFEMQTTNNNKLNILLKEAAMKRQEALKAEQERINALKQDYEDLISRFEEQVQKADLALTDNLVERLTKQKDIALKELDDFVAQTREKAADLGAELPADFEANVQLLQQAILKEFKDGVKDLEAQRGELIEPLAKLATPDPGDTFLKAAGGELAKQLSEGIQAGLDQPEVGVVFDRLKGNILDAFQLDEAQASFILDQFGSIFSSIQSLAAQATEEQISQQDQLIQASEDRISQLEKELEYEKYLKDRGLANDIQRAQQALEREKALKERQEAQRLALEKKAARQRLIMESVQQASNIALAATKVISSESSKGLIGIITATAALALLFGLVSNAKAKASSLSVVPKLKKGGKLKGPSHEAGGVPVFFPGEVFHRYEAEGGEWVLNKKASHVHDDFLADLNAGKYQKLDLHQLATQALERKQIKAFDPRPQVMDWGIPALQNSRAKLIKLENDKNLDRLAASIIEAFGSNTEAVIQAMKERPVDTPLDRPIRRESWKGMTKVVEVIKPQNLHD